MLLFGQLPSKDFLPHQLSQSRFKTISLASVPFTKLSALPELPVTLGLLVLFSNGVWLQDCGSGFKAEREHPACNSQSGQLPEDPEVELQGYSSMKVAAALLGLAWMLHAAVALQICAFNIRSFGDRKLLDQSVSKIIVKILSRYDLVLVQEVRDADLSAVQELGERLNRASKHSYDYVISESLGRENYKEMYLFLYRTQSFSLVDQYQYPNPDSIFSRPPFIVKFAASDSKNKLVLVPLHTSPSEAVAEIDALYDVYLKMIDKWQTDNIMFLGDFNADCSYVGRKDWSSVRLRTSEVFKWLISDDTDTTVGNSDCAYDRIVVSGLKLRKWIVPKSAKVFDFQRAFKLSQEEALAVSDHFPVEVELTSP
uniref:Deoxyribonuclease 1 like 2 n=1 Tax=Laticauda laticaudata TaxID=8630 RepID=A0A8C5S475_LATLA